MFSLVLLFLSPNERKKVKEMFLLSFSGGSSGKQPVGQCRRQKTQIPSLGWEDALVKEMATHSSILAWRIPHSEEPGRPQSQQSQRVGQTEAI